MELLIALVLTCIIEAPVTAVIMWVGGIGKRQNGELRKKTEEQESGDEKTKDGSLSSISESQRSVPSLSSSILHMVYYNFLCNMLTNPILNLSLYGAACLGAGPGLIKALIIIGEICVVASEYALYRLMSHETRKMCFIVALITNVISYLSGLLI
ncbi:MAG: hypothetical protein K6E85_04710 [Lachnospiraceae bacterium]|nr:hypothetical protein [Lachnospiraceae bacterium]